MYAPYEGEEVSRIGGFKVQGYAKTWSIVTVEAFNQCNQRWEDNGTAGTTAAPAFPAGYWNNSPELHAYQVNVLLWDTCYWSSECDAPGFYCGYIRVREGYPFEDTTYLYRGRQASLACDIGQLNAGVDFYTAGFNCGFDNTVLTLHTHL